MKLLRAVRVRGVRVGDHVSPVNQDDFKRVVKVEGWDTGTCLTYEDGTHDIFNRLTGWGVDIRRPKGPELKWESRGFGTYRAEISPRKWYLIEGSPRRGWHVHLYEADGQGDPQELWSDYGPGTTHLKARAAEHFGAE